MNLFRDARFLVIVAATTLTPCSSRAQRILIGAAEGNLSWVSETASTIMATGLVTGPVDTYNLGTLTPTLAELQQYAAVLVFSDGSFVDAATLGNVLADYVDCGGGVVIATFAHYGDVYSPEGRWAAAAYNPIDYLGTGSGANLTLGTVLAPAHPIMAGVTSFDGGSSSYHNTGTAHAGSTVIANWSNDLPLIVERGGGFNGRIVGLNFFPPSDASRGDLWVGTTDGARIMGNTLRYVAEVPAGTLTAPTVEPAADATVSFAADALPCFSTAKMFYRKVGGASTAFNEIAMAESSPGARDWSAQIPGTSVGMDGAQFYLEFNNASRLPADAPNTCLALRVNRSTTIALPAGAYVLAGVPFAPASAAPEAVFDELGAYNPKKWRYGTFDAAVGHCLEPPSATGVIPGQGFWVLAKDAASIAVAGRSTDVPTNQRIVLKEGFNQISNPYSYPVPATDLILPAAVERNLFSWSGGSYAAGNATLSPGVGYWIKNNGPGSQTIEIPIFAPPAPTLVPSVPGMLPKDEPGWSVAMSATAGTFADRENRLGVRPGATNAKDAFDFSDPPPPPAGYVTLSLIGDDETPLMSDYRAESANGASWRLQMTSDQSGQPFRVTFDEERALPPGWRLVAYAPGGLREVDLSADGAITGTVGSAPFVREWTIAAGTPEWTQQLRTELQSNASAFSFSAPIPNPSRGPSFDLALPEAAHVDARVYDVTGRAVRTLVDAQLDRGYHLLEWNGTDASGGRVAAGVYFVRLRTGSHDESRKVVLIQ